MGAALWSPMSPGQRAWPGLRGIFGAMRAHLRPTIWIGLAVALGIGLGQLPLFGVLGYELALVASVFAAIMGLDLGAAMARARQRAPSSSGTGLARSTLDAALWAVACAAIPGALCAIRGLWTATCDWGFGLETYIAMPLITAALGGALGHAIGVACGPRRFLGAVLAQLPLLVVIGWALWRFYAAPPVFSYNAILGYFPGNLYDENVHLGLALLWSRLEELGIVVAAVACVGTRFDAATFRVRVRGLPPGRGRRLAGVTVLAGAVLAAVLHVCGGALGYAIDAADIEDALGGRVETPHFVIFYAHTKEIDADIGLIAADHELRYAQVVAQLGAAPAGKLHSFYFATTEQKGRWMGARDVEMAKPWRREIYLDHRNFPHTSLRHEIAHAVASAFGDPLFGVAARRVLGLPLLVSPGLIEGLAVAVDWPGAYDRPTPHEAVRAMQALGLEPALGDLFSLRFFQVSSARGYTTAGSFIRFLLDRYGAAKLRALYSTGGDFAAAYGVSIDVLQSQWRELIASIELPPTAAEASRERFRGGSVFARPCPHANAARREAAMTAYVAGNRSRAVALMRQVCGDAPEEPRNRLELADMLVSGDPLERTEALGTWLALASDAEQVTSTLRADAYERLARAAAARGDLDGVRALIQLAIALPVDSNERRQLEAERFALALGVPAPPGRMTPSPAADALRNYFFGAPHTLEPAIWALIASIAEPDLGFAHYLNGLQRLGATDWPTAATELERALALGLPGLAFVKNAARRLALAAYRAHDRGRLAVAIATLSRSDMATADRLLAKDWLERITLETTGSLTSR